MLIFPGLSGNLEDIRAVVREENERLEEKLKSIKPAPPKSFSHVGSTEAEALLRDLDITEVAGNDEEPFTVPEGVAEASSFDYSVYAKEDGGTPFLLEHHQKQLELYGVRFGRSGFKMYDMRSNRTAYTITAPSGQLYHGTADGCLGPFGLTASSAANHARIVYEHKQNDEQKRIFRENHPEQFQVRNYGFLGC